MKKILLGTSDTWSMSCLSQQPSEPAYYIEDCWISIDQYLAMDDFQSLLKTVKKPTENQSMLSKYFGLKETCCSIFLKSWLGTNPNQPHVSPGLWLLLPMLNSMSCWKWKCQPSSIFDQHHRLIFFRVNTLVKHPA